VFAAVFLHFEFARKTRWHGTAGERLYSVTLGPSRSALVALGFAVVAVALMLALAPPWPVVALAFAVVGAARFLRRATESWPLPAAMGFVLASYLSLIAQAVNN